MEIFAVAAPVLVRKFVVSLAMDDLSSYSLAQLRFDPMNQTLTPPSGTVVAVAAVEAVVVVAFSRPTPNGHWPTFSGRDYRKLDRWPIPLILLTLAMLAENRPKSM